MSEIVSKLYKNRLNVNENERKKTVEIAQGSKICLKC